MRDWTLAIVFSTLAIILGILRQATPLGKPLASETKPSATAKPNGILLGTHWFPGEGNFGGVKAEDRTWWVAEVGGSVRIVEIQNILFPRKNGFWFAGTNENKSERSFQRYVWAGPLGEQPRTLHPSLPNSSCQDQTNAQDLLFVGSTYLAMKEFESATCATYDEHTAFHVTTLENPGQVDAAGEFGLMVSDVLGSRGRERFNAALSKSGNAKSNELDCGKISARPSDWAILRDKGHWVARGNGSYDGHGCNGYFETEFNIPLQLPKDVVGYDELPIGWPNIQTTFPDAKDAFESPNGNFLLVLRKDELLVCGLVGGKIGAVISRRTLHENEYAVMSQWALGDSVIRWDQQISQLQKEIK
jgi:hypothetical protein